MQKWEYKWWTLTRSTEEGKKPPGILGGVNYYMYPTAWVEGEDFDRRLQQLGNEGWELVSVVAKSDYGGNIVRDSALAIGGVTTSLFLVFKRPKED